MYLLPRRLASRMCGACARPHPPPPLGILQSPPPSPLPPSLPSSPAVTLPLSPPVRLPPNPAGCLKTGRPLCHPLSASWWTCCSAQGHGTTPLSRRCHLRTRCQQGHVSCSRQAWVHRWRALPSCLGALRRRCQPRRRWAPSSRYSQLCAGLPASCQRTCPCTLLL